MSAKKDSTTVTKSLKNVKIIKAALDVFVQTGTESDTDITVLHFV